MSESLCTRNNPYTCPGEPHTHDAEALARSMAFDAEALEWTLRKMTGDTDGGGD